LDVIRNKRDGGELSAEQIKWFIDSYTAGSVADEQASALLMAIVFVGMSPAELALWTAAMIDSGKRVDLSNIGRPTVDKHSTGGVGDKISLTLVPLVAACGAAVPQIAGRGLGHTGGTLDKMEAIPGWRSTLNNAEFIAQLRDIGAVISAAGDDLAPADRALYALRDVTATVESIPLIASSIMSKKIAEGTSALVLDVKTGSGAFMKDPGQAAELARTMIDIGERNGVQTTAFITDMWTPLGNSAGNAVEVAEAIEVLEGGGPPDVVELTVELAREMLHLAGVNGLDPADALADGSARDVFSALVSAQGGDLTIPLGKANEVETISADRAGYVHRLDAMQVGEAAWRLGAGRARKEDSVSATAGVTWKVRPGDHVDKGDVIIELHCDDPALIPAGLDAIDGAVEIRDEPFAPSPLIIERLQAP
ncbi:MAG TPA: thymidine phosphorylase, partial [Microthrixaceae bacterium]|nr:thymidine phosphorylase [Microthrixaceae bacterium]